MKKIFFYLSFLMLLTSCGSDDDICLSADSTPRLKLKFKTADDKLKRLDSLYVDVDYGKAELSNIVAISNADSVLIPLRVDENPYTDFYIRTEKKGNRSKLRINYQTKSIYVSPACGFKKNYENLTPELLESNPVLGIEQNHTTLTDENKTNFYLRF